jgi:RNA polymerase sigma-70 factor (ECF subfamily)
MRPEASEARQSDEGVADTIVQLFCPRAAVLIANVSWDPDEVRMRLKDCLEGKKPMMKIEEATLLDARQKCTQICAAESGPAGERWLVAQAKSGHPSAFGELYECHQVRIYRTAFRILRDRQDAEDVVQQSFQRAFTNICRFREDSTFSTWVTRIAINEALMMLRRRQATTPILETSNGDAQSALAFDPVDKRPTPEQAAVESERRIAVIKAISCLRESLRTVILLREFQGLTSAETARRLGLSLSAVKARTHYAKRYLRRHLERKYKAAAMSF